MVDTTPWVKSPEQMILGSFLADWDDKKVSTQKNYDNDLDPIFKAYLDRT